MATYKFVDPALGMPGPTVSGTYATSAGVPAPFPFGFIAGAQDASFGYGEFVFVAGSNVSAGNLVQIVGNGTARAAGSGTASAGLVGFAPVALSATNVYGWVQMLGYFDSASHSAAAADGVAIKMGTVAGAINSRTASADTYQIFGMRNAGSNTASNAATVYLNYPWFQGF